MKKLLIALCAFTAASSFSFAEEIQEESRDRTVKFDYIQMGGVRTLEEVKGSFPTVSIGRSYISGLNVVDFSVTYGGSSSRHTVTYEYTTASGTYKAEEYVDDHYFYSQFPRIAYQRIVPFHKKGQLYVGPGLSYSTIVRKYEDAKEQVFWGVAGHGVCGYRLQLGASLRAFAQAEVSSPLSFLSIKSQGEDFKPFIGLSCGLGF